MTSRPADISVVVTAHSEGRLAHPSAKSARRAIEHARRVGLSAELVAVLDSPTPETLSYFEEYGYLFDAVGRVEFSDAGLAKNSGAELSSGRYLAFLNAGDMFSENWLAAAYQAASVEEEHALVLHPEFNLFFGRELWLSSSINSDDPGYSPLELLEFNPWTASNFVARSFLLEVNPYAATSGSGFAREDWQWNCEAVAAGAVHRVVPRTIHFVRERGESGRAEEPWTTFRPSKLFDASASLAAPPAAKPEGDASRAGDRTSLSARLGRGLYRPASLLLRGARGAAIKVTSNRPDLLRFSIDVTRASRRLAGALKRPPLEEEWLLEEWRSIHKIEPSLYPSPLVVKGLERRATPRSSVARRYAELCELFGPAPTHVYLLPWLKPGGADAEAILYMTAVVKEDAGSRVVCVTTENEESEWLDRLPEGVRAVEFGKLLAGFSEDEKARLLLRLLVQAGPRVIHNVNSALGYKLFAESGAALGSRSRLFASLYGFEFMPDGSLGGYAIWNLRSCVDRLTRVFTDSRWFGDTLRDIYAFECEKFSVLYVPAPEARPSPGRATGETLNVLWASRLDAEKRPDVLLRVASELAGEPVHFHVYGAPVYSPKMSEVIEKLKALPNVTCYGSYNGFASIPAGEYDIFLYTSERDGMPNVLLEAVAAGLPVVAPDVGGVKELVNDATGFLVSGPDAVGEYVEYVRAIRRDFSVTTPKAEAATALIESRHSWAAFVSNLRAAPGYFSSREEGGAGRAQKGQQAALRG